MSISSFGANAYTDGFVIDGVTGESICIDVDELESLTVTRQELLGQTKGGKY